MLVPTPQSLVSEGIARLAPSLLLEGDGGPELSAVMHDAGIEFDLAHARRAAGSRAVPVGGGQRRADAVRGPDERGRAHDYLERWGLMTPQLVAHMIRFLSEPTSRTYVITYPAGRELCQAYVAGAAERFYRLLTEQVRVRDLIEAPHAGD